MRMVKVFHATLPVSVRAPARVTGVHVPNRPDTYRTFLQADFHRGVRLYPPFAPLSIRVKSPTFSGGIGGRPTRHARPLRAEAAVVYPPPEPSTARARAAMTCDSSALAVIPYTAGPHELCPTPAAPQSRSRSTISPV